MRALGYKVKWEIPNNLAPILSSHLLQEVCAVWGEPPPLCAPVLPYVSVLSAVVMLAVSNSLKKRKPGEDVVSGSFSSV